MENFISLKIRIWRKVIYCPVRGPLLKKRPRETRKGEKGPFRSLGRRRGVPMKGGKPRERWGVFEIKMSHKTADYLKGKRAVLL